ncbi:GNAT family N-acetyltransferase [Anaerosphaera multitolerans]|uniref:GNAT family N-acetyltransferase n=1 Tax=Anaerosphaera multitolerans TaxID=2487351 RepID=UPI001F0BA878|nr:GNAT family N-acetyltransferase [Anaerosphaera multitolerans]
MIKIHSYTIKEVNSHSDYLDFIELPFLLYRDNPYWVPPIKKDYLLYLKGKNNSLSSCPHKLFLAIKDFKVVGRLLVFIDIELNSYHSEKNGYIAEFESIEDVEVSNLLLDKALEFCKEHGMDFIKGPVSLPGGEDHRGFVVNKFNTPPTVMNIYNFKYYNDYWMDYGFTKYYDCYAYRADKEDLRDNVHRIKEILPKIVKRFNYRIDTINLKDLDKDLSDIYEVLNLALPREWKDFKPLSLEEIHETFQLLRPFMDTDFICIARNSEEKPIGFNIALPDYNEILIKLKGKMGLAGLVKFLYYRKKIKKIRMFVLFVVPEYRKKGVSAAIYFKCFANAINKNYSQLEGSTIWEYNKAMITDVEKFGAKRDIIYRIYKKEIQY